MIERFEFLVFLRHLERYVSIDGSEVDCIFYEYVAWCCQHHTKPMLPERFTNKIKKHFDVEVVVSNVRRTNGKLTKTYKLNKKP